jgi:hypothetical protein
VNTRFFAASLLTLLTTVALLGGAGYTISRLTVAAPRDVYRGPNFEFDLANGWFCEREGTETICRPEGSNRKRAIVIMTAKERNQSDNLAAYEAHLRQPQPLSGPNSETPTPSQVKFVRRRQLGGHEWVEGLHFGSEVPNYDTYYLATATTGIGILVTLSVHRSASEQMIGDLNVMMTTLQVYER